MAQALNIIQRLWSMVAATEKKRGDGKKEDRTAGVPYRQAASPSQFGAAPAAGISHVIIISSSWFHAEV